MSNNEIVYHPIMVGDTEVFVESAPARVPVRSLRGETLTRPRSQSRHRGRSTTTLPEKVAIAFGVIALFMVVFTIVLIAQNNSFRVMMMLGGVSPVFIIVASIVTVVLAMVFVTTHRHDEPKHRLDI